MKSMIRILTCALILLALLAAPVRASGWSVVNRHLEVAVSGFEEPYWVELLVSGEAAPMLSAAELAERLSADEIDSPLAALNGYRDGEGFVSLRLYAPFAYSVESVAAETVRFGLDHESPLDCKILLLDAQGEPMIVSSAFTLTLAYATVAFMQASVVVHEADSWNPVITPNESAMDGWMPFVVGIGTVVAFAGAVVLALFLLGFRRRKTYLTIGLYDLAGLGIMLGLVIALNRVGGSWLTYLAIVAAGLIAIGQAFCFVFTVKEQRPAQALVFVIASLALSVAAAFVLHDGLFAYVFLLR